jgi:hypothetical protein
VPAGWWPPCSGSGRSPPELLAEGAGAALAFPLGYATIGLVLTLRRPVNPIGWLYSASGLV